MHLYNKYLVVINSQNTQVASSLVSSFSITACIIIMIMLDDRLYTMPYLCVFAVFQCDNDWLTELNVGCVTDIVPTLQTGRDYWRC